MLVAIFIITGLSVGFALSATAGVVGYILIYSMFPRVSLRAYDDRIDIRYSRFIKRKHLTIGKSDILGIEGSEHAAFKLFSNIGEVIRTDNLTKWVGYVASYRETLIIFTSEHNVIISTSEAIMTAEKLRNLYSLKRREFQLPQPILQ